MRVHPKFGLNPTLPVCFWCGKERGDIAMLGAGYPGEAPMHMTIDYDPCPACEAIWKRGIVILEATRRSESDRMRKQLGPWEFTGRYVVISDDVARRMFQPQEVVDEIVRQRRAVMPPDVFTNMVAGAKADEAEAGHA